MANSNNFDREGAFSATHYIADNAGYAAELPETPIQRGRCAFCGVRGHGVAAENAINSQYFSDSPLMEGDTGHICQCCAHCMNTRPLKNGHWIATPTTYKSISTGDLPAELKAVRRGELGPPIAIHVSENPIRSEHAYLWTPVAETTSRLHCDYAGQTINIAWHALDDLVDAVEDCRWHGFRLDDIRSGRPRVADLGEMGRAAYNRTDDVISTYRGMPTLELALTLSRPADELDRDETIDGNATLQKYV